MKKQYKRVISISLIVCICTVVSSSFFPLSNKNFKEKSGVTIVVNAAEVVSVEIASSFLLDLLATLGVTAEGYSLTKLGEQNAWYVEQATEAYNSYSAENSTGVSFVVNNVAYKITHPDGVSSLSDSFAQRVQEAIANSPEAAAEFEKLINAVQNGVEITGGMLENLWLMLSKGVVDDYNADIENGTIESMYESIWKAEYDAFKYSNWSDEMIDYHNTRTALNETCPVLYGLNAYGKMCILMFNNVSIPEFGVDEGKLVIESTDKDDFADCFDLFVFNGTRWTENLTTSPFYGVQGGSDYKKITFKFGDIVFRYDIFNPYIPEFPYGLDLTDAYVGPTVINPSDVITDIPEKIVNDDVISIPDGTTVEDIVTNPDLTGEIIGEVVPVNEIDYPWENVADPDITIDPSVPGDEELDTNDYKIKPAVIDKFPFCIPWDVIKCFSLLGQEPEVPKFEYRFYIKSLKINETIVIDLKDFEPVANVSRWFFRIFFIFGLAVATRNLIRG